MTGATVRPVARQDQHSAIGSDYYHGGIVIDDYGGLHPAKYNRALRDLARRRGAILRSHARVLGIDDHGSGKIVRTVRGDIEAGEVVITTNGYTDRQATPQLARRLVPVKSYQIATEPLPPELLAELIPGARMVSDTRRDIIYTRPSPMVRACCSARVRAFWTGPTARPHSVSTGGCSRFGHSSKGAGSRMHGAASWR